MLQLSMCYLEIVSILPQKGYFIHECMHIYPPSKEASMNSGHE